MGTVLRWYRFGPDVMTVAEFARMAGLSDGKVRAMITRGELPGFRDPKYPILIPTTAAKRWMEGLPNPRGEYTLTIRRCL